MKKKPDRKSVSITTIWVTTFILLLLISVSVIGGIVFSNWRISISATTKDSAQHINQDIASQIDSFLQFPVTIIDVNQKIIENNIFDLANEDMRERFFVGALSSCEEEVYSFSYGTEDGEYYGARRNENGVIEIMRNDAGTGGESWYYSVKDDLTAGNLTVNAGKFDPRTRAWYQTAAEAGTLAFSPVYKHFVMDDLAVSVACPVYTDQGELAGVLGAHMLLTGIGKELESIVSRNHAYAFIVEKDSGYLIASSVKEDNFNVLADGSLERKTLANLTNPEIQAAYRQYVAAGDPVIFLNGKTNGLFVNIQEYNQAGLSWLIISAVPESLLTAELFRNIRLAGVLVVIAVLVSFFIYYFIARRLLKPIKELLMKAEKFSAGDLSQRISIARTDEIGRISESFNKVANNMQRLINHLEDTVALRTEELHKTNKVLEENQNQLRLILDSTAEAIYGTDLEGLCTFCNESCLNLLGYTSQKDLLGKDMHDLIHHSLKDGTPFPKEACPIIQAIRRGEGVHSSEEVLWRSDWTCFDAEYRALPQCRNGQIVGSVLTFVDITERKKDEEQVRFLSCHDSMTGLMNRRCFEHELKAKDIESNLPISVIFIDINGLKMVNDTFGHSAGDELIMNAAAVLNGNCREGDIAARVGGDEFAVLLPQTRPEDAEILATRLKTEFSHQKINVISCSMALGVDTKFKSYQRMEKVMETAENEMYKEKAVSKQNFSVDAIESMIKTLHVRSPREKWHSQKVGRMCEELGTAMGLPEPEIKKLREAGYLHDIGKIALSETILGKSPETLTEAEREMMRQHPAVGYRILNLSEDTSDLANGVCGHHERWDGTGYPKGLKGEEIARIARIISIAEAYDRMTNYGTCTQTCKLEALQTLQENAGKRFDPQITALFVQMMRAQRQQK